MFTEFICAGCVLGSIEYLFFDGAPNRDNGQDLMAFVEDHLDPLGVLAGLAGYEAGFGARFYIA